MIQHLRQIKTLAVDMRDTMSRNDDRREKLQDITDLCDDLLEHFVDDGR